MNYSSFFGTAFKISMFSITSSPSDNFIASFPIWVLFASFSYLIAVAGTFNVILNKRDKIGHPYLSLILGEMLLVFHCIVGC